MTTPFAEMMSRCNKVEPDLQPADKINNGEYFKVLGGGAKLLRKLKQ